MTTRFDGKIFNFTQPDGTTIVLRGFGDQYRARFETLDGTTVVENPANGYYEAAPQRASSAPLGGLRATARNSATRSALAVGSRRWEQRREEKRQQLRALRLAAAAGGPLLAPPQRQTVGDFVGLCLLVDFADEPATISRTEVENFCNQPGYTGFGNQGSVRDYFLDNSGGRCRYSNVVPDYYRAAKPKTYYTDETVAQPIRARELITEAVTHLRSRGFDFSQLTADGQGFVYALNFFYAGPVTNRWAKGLWPHSFEMGTPITVAPGRKLFDYQFTAMGSELELGTFCHENGHMLCDYPDLYDYQYDSSGVGGFCLMCSGNNRDQKNPIAISAYLKRLSGWARSVTPLEHGLTVTLRANSNDFAIFSRGGREYFIIENRQKSGRDSALPDAGLAVWHVDEDGDNSNQQMSASSHYELSLEQADGRFDLERLEGHDGDGTDLFEGSQARFGDDTTPNSKWWNGTASNLTLDQISSAGSSMSFRALLSDVVVPPPPPTNPLQLTSSPDLPIPDNDSTGVTDVIQVASAATIAGIKVGVEITHTFRGDLRLLLTTPWGTVIELHPKGRGGNADDLTATFDEASLPALATLRGRSAQGAWRLTVQDLAPADMGRLKRWSLDVAPAPGASVIELQESPGTPIPDFPGAGIERSVNAVSTGKVGTVEVSVDITHTWIGDLELNLVSPSGTVALLHSSSGGDEDNLVRTYTPATAPALASLAGQSIAGAWRLRVVDKAAQDKGKLNRWSLRIKADG